MPITVAQIAAKALNAVQGAITDAIHGATLVRTARGLYNASAGTYGTTTTTQTGRAVFTNSAPSPDQFPGYVVGPNDQVLMLEGFTSVRENDVVTIGGRAFTVMAVQDVAGACSVFMAAAR